MKIDLKPNQEAYLRRLVSSGAFATLEEALDALIPSGEQSDDWMKPYVAEALAELNAGKVADWTVDPLRDELRSRRGDRPSRAD